MIGNGWVSLHSTQPTRTSRLAQDATDTEFFLGDALPLKGAGGSVRQITDSIGALTLEKRYAPFGEVLARECQES